MQSITQASPPCGQGGNMKRKIWTIAPKTLKRRYFDTAEQFAAELAASIRESGEECSLFTDYRWVTEPGTVISPYFGYVTNLSIGYDGPFTEKELLKALLREGIYPNRLVGQSSAYILSTKNLGEVWAYYKGVEV